MAVPARGGTQAKYDPEDEIAIASSWLESLMRCTSSLWKDADSTANTNIGFL